MVEVFCTSTLVAIQKPPPPRMEEEFLISIFIFITLFVKNSMKSFGENWELVAAGGLFASRATVSNKNFGLFLLALMRLE